LDKLYYLLLEIREEPYKYLERPTLKYLHSFMSGYIVYRNYIDREIHYDFYQGFSRYIQEKFQIYLSVSDMDIIEFFSTSEEEAFNRYFELLDEYLELQGEK